MTLALLLVVGAFAAAGSGWALARDGSVARAGAVGGVLAIVAVGMLAVASPTPASLTPDATGAVPGTLWGGALVPGAYLRVVIALWSGASAVLALVAWLLGGVAALRGLLPATLAGLVGAAVALAASTPALGAVAAGAAGLASIPAVVASPRGSAVGVAAREVRIAVATALVVVAVVAVVPVLARLILANPEGPVTAPGSGETAAIAFGLLALALVVAARIGSIPWHVRISALSDTVPAGSLPLVAAWLPLPLAAVAVGVTAGVIAPLMPQVGAAHALIVAAVLLATVAAALVALFQDDLRHAVGYVTIADFGIFILAVAALDPALWGPARTWLAVAAVTKTALAAWATVVEHRFETRSIPELRGWLRPSPLLAIALLLVALASIGLPGSAVMTARLELTGRAAGGPWDALLLIASVLTVPAYARWLWVGLGAPTSHVDRAVPEISGFGRLTARRLTPKPPVSGLPVEQEGAHAPSAAVASAPADRAATRGARRARFGAASDKAAASGASTGLDMAASDAPTAIHAVPRPSLPRRTAGTATTARAANLVRQHRTGLLSGAVLALALLATLVAFGGFDVARAACEPTPAVAGISASCR